VSNVQTRELDEDEQADQKELFSLPYFLTAKHEAIIEEYYNRKPEIVETTEEESELRRLVEDDTCLYKSSFLKEKLVQQADRRKKERKPANTSRLSTLETGQKKGGNKAPRVNLQQIAEQTLLEQIEELKSDLAYRQEEMQKAISRTETLERENAELAKKVLS
jgi:hypothetical protein